MFISIVIEICKGCLGFPSGLVVKKSACQAGDAGSVLEVGRFPEEGNGNPLQYSYLGDTGAKECGGLQSMGSQKSWT